MKRSLRNINWRLFISLLIMGLVPTVYTTVRTYFIGQLPGDWAYSIAGQLTWVSLLCEILDEAIILPLFFCLGSTDNRQEFSNRIKTGLFASGVIYTCFAAIIIFTVKHLLLLMSANQDLIEASAVYIKIESVANVFGILCRFLCVAIIAAGEDKYVYIITAMRLGLCVVFDMCLLSSLPFSFNLGVNGVGLSNIIVNAILLVISYVLLQKEGFITEGGKMSFSWMKTSVRINGTSGLESLVRNVAYIIMVSKMVNMVGEQGTYWVANNFIWGWMLLPVLQLGELIKQETSRDKDNIGKNTPAYFFITTATVILWIATIPFYKPFMRQILGFSDVDKLFHLVMILFVPYIAFAYQNIFDATFYGRGLTRYMLFESVMTNSLYFGGVFIAYLSGFWVPSLKGIALMFGIGNIFDSIVSGLVYRHFLKETLS